MTRKKRICVDFDGVIHAYTAGFKDGSVYDVPVAGSIEAMLKLREEGYDVVIFSARPAKQILQWLGGYWPKGKVLPQVTNIKEPAVAYIDDRGLRFTNWADVMKYFV